MVALRGTIPSMARRLLGTVVAGISLLSLLACLGAGWWWLRSCRGGQDRVTFRAAGVRYTLRSGPGGVALAGPPPVASRDEADRAGRLVGAIRNDHLRWQYSFVWGQYATGITFEKSQPLEPGTAPVSLEQRLSHAKVNEGLVRALLDALDDPDRFVAAHFILSWQFRSHRLHPKDREDWAGFTHNGLRVRWQWARDPVRAGWRLGEQYHLVGGTPHIDPGQLPPIRDFWHDKLDVPVWSGPHWWLVTATALPPLAWLGVRTRRTLVLRRRKRLGLCLNCGYDLRGSPGGRCSECGEAVPGKAAASAAR